MQILCFINRDCELSYLPWYLPHMLLKHSSGQWLLDLPIKGSFPLPHPRGHLHCMDKGDTISSSMSSTSSVMMKWAGLGRVLPIQLGSMLRAATSEWMPGLLTIWKPQRISICCQRCRRSRSAAVTSLRACLKTDERELQACAGCESQQEWGLLKEQLGGYV